ncbi:MAG: MATE family efflux transporter [Bacteroidales bacterium]|nr:MATE family efflux transporter [Bacteroidales bacterium]MCF8403419.1 MATE family efflux transporter [Bacteroidales bacterium]
MKDLTTGKESKLIMQFAAPMLLGNVFQQMYNIVDSIVIGNYIGKEALAAVGASFPIIFALISMVIGFATGATIIIAQYFGAKQMENVKRTIDTIYIVLFFASIVLSAVGIIFSGPIFRLIQLPEDVLPGATLYMQIYISGLVFFFGFNGTSAILRGLGDSKTPLYFMIISTITNIVLDLVFVVVFKWGIAGVAIATIISQGGAFLTAIIYLNKTHDIVKLSVLKLKFDKAIFRESLRIGLPSGFQQTFVSIGLIAVVWIVNLFGTDVIAAYSIAMRIDSLAALPAMNFSAALATFVGQNLGANKVERVRSGLISTFWMTSVVSFIITAIAILFSRSLMGVFTNDANVIEIGANYLIIVSAFYVVFSAMFVLNGVMRGAGDTLIPMFITLLALWVVRIPLSWYLSQHFGETGIWWAIPIGWFLGMILSWFYYLSGKWKTKGVVKHPILIK